MMEWMCIFDYGRHVGRHGVLKREYLERQKAGDHKADALSNKDPDPIQGQIQREWTRDAKSALNALSNDRRGPMVLLWLTSDHADPDDAISDWNGWHCAVPSLHSSGTARCCIR